VPLQPTLNVLTLGEAAEMLQGLYRVDMLQLREGVPGILGALMPDADGRRMVRYIRRDPREQWQTVRSIWGNRGGDCEDLASAVAAELTLKGIPARPVIRKVNRHLAHATVQVLATGQILDPSKLGGMGSPRERAEHAAGMAGLMNALRGGGGFRWP
jgi:hypothetical protein